MKSSWFWGTAQWEAYQAAYYAGKVRPEEYKSSLLAQDHDFTGAARMGLAGTIEREPSATEWILERRCAQLLDLTKPEGDLWTDVRKSYHQLIHRANEEWNIAEEPTIGGFRMLHQAAFGSVRSDATFAIQEQWLKDGLAMIVGAWKVGFTGLAAAAFWIVYQGGAYFASAPSIIRGLQHAVVWESLMILKRRGIKLVDMGQTDGNTNKECNIGFFKRGWGGKEVPFEIIRRKS